MLGLRSHDWSQMIIWWSCVWPVCVAARSALGKAFTFLMMFFQDLSTCRNILASVGSCLWISGPLKMLSKYSQFLWHVSHSSCAHRGTDYIINGISELQICVWKNGDHWWTLFSVHYQCLAEQGELSLPLIYFGHYGTHITWRCHCGHVDDAVIQQHLHTHTHTQKTRQQAACNVVVIY